MSRYLKNLLTALCGVDPYAAELEELKEKYKKTSDPEYGNKKKKYSILYAVISVASIGISLVNSLYSNILDNEVVEAIIGNYVIFYLLITVLLSVYFFYKRIR